MHLTGGAIFVIWLLWVLADELKEWPWIWLIIAIVVTTIAVLLGVQ